MFEAAELEASATSAGHKEKMLPGRIECRNLVGAGGIKK